MLGSAHQPTSRAVGEADAAESSVAPVQVLKQARGEVVTTDEGSGDVDHSMVTLQRVPPRSTIKPLPRSDVESFIGTMHEDRWRAVRGMS